MPKRLEIYVDQFTRELTLDTNSPLRIADSTFRFGWDEPEKIWEAMNDTVPGMICSRVRLVKRDSTPIMSVADRTDEAITEALRLFASRRAIRERHIQLPVVEEIAQGGLKAVQALGWKG